MQLIDQENAVAGGVLLALVPVSIIMRFGHNIATLEGLDSLLPNAGNGNTATKDSGIQPTPIKIVTHRR